MTHFLCFLGYITVFITKWDQKIVNFDQFSPLTLEIFTDSKLFSIISATPMTHSSVAPPPSMEPGIVPQLQNIVSTVNLGCPLDLKKIATHARNAEYNPKRFAAVIMRIRDPRTTALIFR